MMRIVTDSAADLVIGKDDPNTCVSLSVRIGGKDYLDGKELDADGFYALLTAGGDFPQTSQPSPEDFFRIFRKAKLAGDTVLCFTLSSGLSGTYQSACIAKQMLEYDPIHIIDTGLVSHPIGILTEYAQRRIDEGAQAEQIVSECEALKSRVRIYAGLETLEYLYKGGRLSRTSAAVGELAGIKPVITLSPEGKVVNCAKAIGVPRAIGAVLAKVQAEALDPAFPVYSLYSAGTQNVQKLEQKLAQAGIAVTQRRQVGPTIGAHVGPGVYGVACVVKE